MCFSFFLQIYLINLIFGIIFCYREIKWKICAHEYKFEFWAFGGAVGALFESVVIHQTVILVLV